MTICAILLGLIDATKLTLIGKPTPVFDDAAKESDFSWIELHGTRLVARTLNVKLFSHPSAPHPQTSDRDMRLASWP